MKTKDEIINYLKTREELLPIVTILEDAAKVQIEKNKVIASNNAEKDKLIKERNKLESKILAAKELFNFLEVANLEEDIKKIDLKLASIDAQLKRVNNTAAISEETFETMCHSIRTAYKSFMQHQAAEVLEMLEPLEEMSEENHALMDFVNDAFKIVQFELYQDKRTGYYDTVRLWDNDIDISLAIDKIIDLNRKGVIEKASEGRRI